jgi:hypothetical protein
MKEGPYHHGIVIKENNERYVVHLVDGGLRIDQ